MLHEAANTRAIHFSNGLAELTASQTESAEEGFKYDTPDINYLKKEWK